jgi:hypothetical protein
MTTPSRRRRFKNTAVISRIPAGTDPDARVVVVASLRCSPVYEMDQDKKERAGMGTVKVARTVYCAVPGTAVQDRMRFILGSTDYRIHRAVNHPADAPQFMELFLEDEQP